MKNPKGHTIVIRFAADSRAEILRALTALDPLAYVHPEGNPVTAWVTTKAAFADVANIPNVEHVVHSVSCECGND